MATFSLTTEPVSAAKEKLSSITSQIESISSSINGYDITSEDSFDFSGAKNALIQNIDALKTKIQNAVNILDAVITSHTQLQNSLNFNNTIESNTNNVQNNTPENNTTVNYPGTYTNVGGYQNVGGSINNYSGNNTPTIKNKTSNKSLEEALALAGINTSSLKIENGKIVGLSSVEINTKDGKKKFDIFEQTQFAQWTNGGWNLSDNGCAVCSVTTIVRAYGDKEYENATPSDIINKGHNGVPFNFFADGIKDTLTNCGVDYEQVNYGTNDSAAMVEQLKKGTPMIVSVRGNGQQYANSSGHTIVLLGMTEDGKVIVGDSYSAFNGNTIYTKSVEEIFSVMCNDPCNSYETKEVLVINGNKKENTQNKSKSQSLLSNITTKEETIKI